MSSKCNPVKPMMPRSTLSIWDEGGNMTIEQAMQRMEQDQIVIEQALSDLQTAKHLNAMGESELAVNVYASVRANLRRQMNDKLGVIGQELPRMTVFHTAENQK
jgi:hypothetical protein